jgi:hypothetical protein
MPPGTPHLRAIFALVLGCSAVACNLDNKGDDPPRAMLYFPNALALSPERVSEPGSDPEGARYLYVVNSDFDLRYNAGTLQAYSLDGLKAAVDACDPKPCIIDPDEAFEAEVRIPAFSQAIASSASGERLFIATRTGESLSYVTADPTASGQNVLRCEGGCDLEKSAAPADVKILRDLEWPEEPVSVIAGKLDDWFPARAAGEPAPSDSAFDASEDEYAVVAHRGGEVSLFVEHGDAMLLTSYASGIAPGATDLAYDSVSRLVYASVFLPTSPRILARFGVNVPERSGGGPDPLRATVFSAGGVTLQPINDFRDTRSIVFLPAMTRMGAALATPNALIAAQRPSALVLADVASMDIDRRDGGFAVAQVKGTTTLGAGASRLAAGVVDGIPIAVIASFDSRELAVVDLRTMLTRSVVPNLSGPYGVVLDSVRGLVYVTDFRSSVIRILDIKPALEQDGSDPVEIVATLGRPRVLQELR